MFETIVTVLLGVTLFRLSLIDLRTLRLPDRFTLPLIFGGWVVNAFILGAWPWGPVAAAATGYLVFALIGGIFFRWRQIEGLGLGDAKLLAAAGAWLGLRPLPLVILLAALGGLAFAILTTSRRTAHIAFGPWLALSFFVVWLTIRS
ncbi:leader peptidase (prepilin peptidase) / N-methyltransferase [Loktanella atrilutea]|uniref:Leader peptidase (Prepilin peptidase) / N-methyltransferase n=1 Tax=Loktanella atrilutea TaxID=366533 RepID=A0A1M5G4M7_LOKAT|nr:A24 family peptidase [Loktanella atrilutea]SHF98676.1 leader peptidase (prepilin peptidase) / N-methyltransferase [Loktanella atrilutea]